LFYAGVPFSRHHSKDFERFDKEDPDDHQLIMRRGDVSLSGTTSLTPEILRSDFNITESVLKPGNREDLENHGPGISRVTFPSSTNFIKKFCIENEMKKILENSNEGMIWVTHGPPFGTMNDMIKAKKHVGSSAIRELILKHQPLMTLHGHIHETVDVNKGKFMDTLGKTCCFSSGNAPQKKFVAAVIVDLDNIASARRVLK
jgi:Icc-related predicted phosphoesterase